MLCKRNAEPLARFAVRLCQRNTGAPSDAQLLSASNCIYSIESLTVSRVRMLKLFTMLNKPLLTVLISLLAAPLAAAQRYTRSGSYAPSYGACPSTPLVRPASSGLAPAEVQFLSTRREQVKCALEEYLERVAIPDFDVGAYIACLAGDLDKVPVMGLTFSGGGERSLLSSYGLYRGLDGRVEEARKAGTGGLLQAMTYVTGRECTYSTCGTACG